MRQPNVRPFTYVYYLDFVKSPVILGIQVAHATPPQGASMVHDKVDAGVCALPGPPTDAWSFLGCQLRGQLRIVK